MRIVVELPTWLGDSVMATPTLQNLVNIYPNSEIILVGSRVAVEITANYPNVTETYIISRKGNRFLELFSIAKEILRNGKVDISISLRTSIYSGILQYLTKATIRVAISKLSNRIFITTPITPRNYSHQVEKYLQLLSWNSHKIEPYELKLYFQPKKFNKPTLGINSGATYGSAKRWSPKKFAEVAIKLSRWFDIVLFGGPDEVEIVGEIADYLQKEGITNFQNLAGKTSIQELAEYIGGLNLFITNDSGPMHIAGAYKIPTVAIFGSTNHKETNQWKNSKQVIIRKDLECSPCMKRECPLKHHKCMEDISVQDVLNGIELLTNLNYGSSSY